MPDERTLAFPAAMAAAGLPLPAAYRRVIHPTPTDAYRLTRELMALPEPPTALFATTGNLALGAFEALRELGLRIPGDVSLLSFDNYPWTSVVTPALDVIEQPVEAMGRAAARIVLREVAEPGRPVERLRFGGTLLKRGSCGPPPA